MTIHTLLKATNPVHTQIIPRDNRSRRPCEPDRPSPANRCRHSALSQPVVNPGIGCGVAWDPIKQWAIVLGPISQALNRHACLYLYAKTCLHFTQQIFLSLDYQDVDLQSVSHLRQHAHRPSLNRQAVLSLDYQDVDLYNHPSLSQQTILSLNGPRNYPALSQQACLYLYTKACRHLAHNAFLDLVHQQVDLQNYAYLGQHDLLDLQQHLLLYLCTQIVLRLNRRTRPHHPHRACPCVTKQAYLYLNHQACLGRQTPITFPSLNSTICRDRLQQALRDLHTLIHLYQLSLS